MSLSHSVRLAASLVFLGLTTTLQTSAQTRSDIEVSASPQNGPPLTVINRSTTHTATVTLSLVWNTRKLDPKTGQYSHLARDGNPASVTLGPGQRRVVSALPPAAKDGYSARDVANWHWNVEWPYKAAEDRRVEAAKRQAELAKQNDAASSPSDLATETAPDPSASSAPFQTFLARLKRSSKSYGYYPGDPHYGPGYYDKTGKFLGSQDPGGDGNPPRNPGFDRFGPAPSLSNFDKRYPDPAPDQPLYANLLPSSALPPAALAQPSAKPSDPGWSFNDRRETWTDSAGRVFLVEPLPPELRNLTPEQLGILPDTSWVDFAPDPMTDEDWERMGVKSSATAVPVDELPDLAWNQAGVDFSAPSVGGEAANDIEQMWADIIANEDPIATLFREVKARDKAERESIISNEYMNKTEGHLMWKRIAEGKAAQLIQDAANYGATPPTREEALKQAWQSIGGTYVSKERMQSWNATANEFGFFEPKDRYLIEEDTPPETAPKGEPITP